MAIRKIALCCGLALCALPGLGAHRKAFSVPRRTLLWKAGSQGYETYRIPGIVVTSRGTVLAYCVGRKVLRDGDWSDGDIFLRRSTDHGRSWTPSQHIAGNGHGVTDNPVAIASRQKSIVYFLYQHNYKRVFYMSSRDDGASFSVPVDITYALEGLRSQFAWTVVALGPGHAIELRSGRLLVPVWLAAGDSTGKGRRKHAPSGITTLYSDDHGKTWKHGEMIAVNTPEMVNPNEMQVIQLDDGRVMANIRAGDQARRRAVAISPDGISHWTTPHFDKQLYDPICAAGIVRYDRKHILFTNPDSESLDGGKSGPHGLRSNLTLKISSDEGKTWPVSRLLHAGSSGYSDIAVGPHKSIYDIFEFTNPPNKANNVSVLQFDLAWAISKTP